ncbi:NB-ARC domain-containing protein [Dactylosporangium siamense]|uniref:NB-ARC domain-containing protein n=1 Tax=Dactylosporangium siamense TaxID=685454 RepID=A0A919PX20_9ACTN|nr:WD40 repeat domain-containing protein [Dactylosporangium siamense]GIG52006.1 hypothetical protein Dsi01nite_100470 [Dactylosporangium siamense]
MTGQERASSPASRVSRDNSTQINAEIVNVHNASPADPPGRSAHSPAWMLPIPRPALVERAQEAQRLLTLVCESDLGPGVPIGVHGGSGFGKTSLVMWLCAEELVRARFSGGLLWLMLGEPGPAGVLAGQINELIEQLTGSRPTFGDPVQAGYRLGEVLDTQPGPVLLVLDDVYDQQQLLPFRMGGRSCLRLVTTRRRWIVPPDSSVWVDRMNRRQATALLTVGVEGAPPELVERILDGTGHWPALLELANRVVVRRIRHGVTAETALRDVADRLATSEPDMFAPGAFGPDDVNDRGQAIASVLRAGLALLTEADNDRLEELSIFPVDVDIPIAVLELLWAQTGRLTRDRVQLLCYQLADLSLVLYYRADPGTIRLHRVVRSYIVHVTAPDRRQRLHGQLLAAAAATLPAGQPPAWWELPPRYDYVVAHLAEHLTAAGRRPELVATVTDLRWVHVRLTRHGATAVERDLDRAGTPAAIALARAVRQSAHLFTPLAPPGSLGAVLASRLARHAQTDGFVESLPRPRLANRWPLPDRPQAGLVRTLTGHTREVVAAAAAPDGGWLATAGQDGAVRIWNPVSGELRCTLAHAATVLAVAPDGAWLATADRGVRIWDPVTGSPLHKLVVGPGPVHALAVAPDGAWLAAAGQDGTTSIWDTRTGDCRHVLAGHTERVDALAAAADGTWLATAGYDRTIRLWDPATGAALRTLTGHTHWVTALATAADGSWLASTGHDGTVRVWDPTSGALEQTLTRNEGPVVSLAVVQAGAAIAAGGWDGAIRIWDRFTGELLHTLTGHGSWVSALCTPRDGGWLASAAQDGTAYIWDPVTGARHNALTGHTNWIRAVAASADGGWVATAGQDGTARIWDPAAVPDARTPARHTDAVTTLAVSPDGDWVASAGLDRMVRIWQPATGEPMQFTDGQPVLALAVDPNGDWLAAAGRNGMDLWNPRKPAERRTLAGGIGRVLAIAVAPDGGWLAAGDQDGTVVVWDARTGRDPRSFTAHLGPVEVLAAAPDGRWLATGGPDHITNLWDPRTGEHGHALATGRVRAIAWAPQERCLAAAGQHVTVWDTDTGERRHTLIAHKEPVRALAFASDGSWLATGGQDGTVRIWDVSTGACRHALTGHTHWVTALATGPGGTWLASTGYDGTIRIWDPVAGTPMAAIRVDSPLVACAWLPGATVICAGGTGGGVYAFDLLR